MRKGGQKSKGSNFERQICKYLTKWMSGQDKDYWVYRSPSSGAMATIVKQKNLSGDIIAVDSRAEYFMKNVSLECKDGYPSSSFNGLMKKNKSDEITSFWTQAVGDAKKGEREPILIYHKKLHNILVGVRYEFFKHYFESTLSSKRHLKINFDDGILPSVVFLDIDDFFCEDTLTIFKRIGEL